METWKVRDIIPGMADANTLTPNRRFLQVIFERMPNEGYLNTIRNASRNVWDSYLGGKREDGAPLNIQGDPLFLSICDACGITAENIEEIEWKEGSDAFKRAIGMKVKGTFETEYVKPYHIPNSQSEIDERFRYSTMVLEGEDKFFVFRQQGHVIITDEDELDDIKRRASEVAEINEHAREERQHRRGVASTGEREGTGAIINERTLGGRGMSAKDGEDPAISRDKSRKEPKA